MPWLWVCSPASAVQGPSITLSACRTPWGGPRQDRESRPMPLAAVPKWLLLLCVLLVLSCCTGHVHGAASQLEAVCGANVKGHCNECICCCYRGAVPAYQPNGCQCQVSSCSNCTCYDCTAQLSASACSCCDSSPAEPDAVAMPCTGSVRPRIRCHDWHSSCHPGMQHCQQPVLCIQPSAPPAPLLSVPAGAIVQNL